MRDLYEEKKVSRVCFWNRPGRGFSDNAPSPFSLNSATNALTSALHEALTHNKSSSAAVGVNFDEQSSIQPPFQNRTLALVSHGLGGLYSRAFAAKHVESVHSLFLVDTLHEDLVHQVMGRPSQGFSIWLNGMFSPFAIRRQLSWLIHHKGPESRYLSFGTRAKDNGNTIVSDSTRSLAFTTNPRELKASLQDQIAALNGDTISQIQKANSVLKDTKIPLAVVSSAQSIRRFKKLDWSSLQRKLTKITTNNVAWEILDGPHDLWIDDNSKLRLQKLFTNILSVT